jgi:hypothetical protein
MFEWCCRVLVDVLHCADVRNDRALNTYQISSEAELVDRLAVFDMNTKSTVCFISGSRICLLTECMLEAPAKTPGEPTCVTLYSACSYCKNS